MKVLVPKTISDAMFTSSTIAEPAAGETAWDAAATYAVGDRRIRAATHRVYECVKAVSVARATLPENDPTYWLDAGPTLKWAAFDSVVSTASETTTSLVMVLRPGFFNALAMYALEGAQIDVSIKAAPGGAVFYTYTGSLYEPPTGWYSWLFGTVRPLRKLVLEGILPYPDAELTITITAPAGQTVGVGQVALGDMQSLLGEADELEGWGPEYGATAEPITNSYIKIQLDGTAKIVRRHAATDMRVQVVLPADVADTALAIVQDVLDVPACWIADPTRDGLNVYGLASGSLSYSGPEHSIFNLTVKGLT